ncbi:MAG: hypothetical protein R3E77_07025 [Steroidobacteraceae bacterium]
MNMGINTAINGFSMMRVTAMSAATACAVLLAGASHAAAQSRADAAPPGGCIVLKTVAEVEVSSVENGERVTRLVPATKVVPGDEVVWTVTASNVCKSSVEKVVINNPVPEHMAYVANSAVGPGTEVSYSLDGERYGKAEQLVVTDADGSQRPARADEYGFLRWTLESSLKPGAVAFARYRAVLR